jgi:hypothetical protein
MKILGVGMSSASTKAQRSQASEGRIRITEPMEQNALSVSDRQIKGH